MRPPRTPPAARHPPMPPMSRARRCGTAKYVCDGLKDGEYDLWAPKFKPGAKNVGTYPYDEQSDRWACDGRDSNAGPSPCPRLPEGAVRTRSSYGRSQVRARRARRVHQDVLRRAAPILGRRCHLRKALPY